MPHKPKTHKYEKHLIHLNQRAWGISYLVPGRRANTRTFGSKQSALTACELAYAAFEEGQEAKSQEIKDCLSIREPEE